MHLVSYRIVVSNAYLFYGSFAGPGIGLGLGDLGTAGLCLGFGLE